MLHNPAVEQSGGGLSLRTKLLYSSSSLGGEALTQSRGAWLIFYYGEEAELLPLAVVGGLLTAGRLVEALDDALIGYWSDRTRSRLGRRIPFILGATPFWALFFVLLFTPPQNSGTLVTAAYLFVVFELFHLFSTLSGGPYEALLPEIAKTAKERVSIVGIRVYFGAAGGGCGLIGSSLLIDTFSFQAMALTMAALALIFRYLGMIGIWKVASRTQPPADIPFRTALRETFSNRPFLCFLPTFVLFQIGLQMMLGMLPFYVKGVLGFEEEGRWVAGLTAATIGVTVAIIPLLVRLAARTSKRQVYSGAMLAASLLFPLVFFAGFIPGLPQIPQIFVLMAIVGAPIAGVFLFPAALTADIVDYDTVNTGLRREATYYGSQNFVEKTATSLSPLLLTLLLLIGKTAEDPLGIRLVGPVAGVIVFVGYLIFRLYDLPDEVKPETRSGAGTPSGGRA